MPFTTNLYYLRQRLFDAKLRVLINFKRLFNSLNCSNPHLLKHFIMDSFLYEIDETDNNFSMIICIMFIIFSFIRCTPQSANSNNLYIMKIVYEKKGKKYP